MKTLLTGLVLAVTLLFGVPSSSYADTEEVLRATQSLNVDDSEYYFHGQVFLQDSKKPKDLIVVVENLSGEEVVRTRCLLKKTAPKTFQCALVNQLGPVTASVRLKRGNSDILNIIVRNYGADFTTLPDLELTTKVIVNTRVASYTDIWHYHDTTLVNVYRKENL